MQVIFDKGKQKKKNLSMIVACRRRLTQVTELGGAWVARAMPHRYKVQQRNETMFKLKMASLR